MRIFKKLNLSLILGIILVVSLSGCNALNDVGDLISSLLDEDTEEANTETTDENTTGEKEPSDDDSGENDIATEAVATAVHKSSNNPYNLSSDLILLINTVGVELIQNPGMYTKAELINEFIHFLDFSEETITEDDLHNILDDLYTTIDTIPTNYPISPLSNATYYNYSFIGTQFHYNSEDAYNYWFGSFEFEQSLTEAMDFFQKSLSDEGFTIESAGVGDEYTLGLADAIIIAKGEIDNLPYEAGLLFTENADGTNEVIVTFEHKEE